jgi:hypothetical protein
VKHAELVERAARWLHNSQKHSVVLVEINSTGNECPDVIGWRGGFSTLVECKASRADFFADRKKVFRAHPEVGMGEHRWYCAPPGLLAVGDLPDGWGLVEPLARSMRVVRAPTKVFDLDASRMRNQQLLLASALERVAGGWGRGQVAYPFVRHDGSLPPSRCATCYARGFGGPFALPRCPGCGVEMRAQVGAVEDVSGEGGAEP